MIRRILVPLEGSPFSETAIKHACDIALRTGAEVFGKAVIDQNKPLSSNAPAHALAARWAAETRLEGWKDEKRQLRDVLELFDQLCTEAGVAHQKAHLQGVPGKMVIEQSIFYDLVVTSFHGEVGVSGDDGEDSPGTLLGTSITPFLVVPEKYREIKDVLVCFDGSLSAMRSLQDFAVLAEVSSFNITIITADKPEEEARFLLTRASDYLQSYGVSDCHTIIDPRPIQDVVSESCFYDNSLDLVVLGARSRNIIRDYFWGSLVTDLLKLGRVPVFIGQ